MQGFKTFLKILLVFLLLLGVLTFVVFNYSWLFSKTVRGEILDLERITTPSALNVPGGDVQSYAILLQDEDGYMYTFSAVDRQWQVAKKGYCVMATLYRYPPWNLEKGGTFYNAQLKQIYKCPKKEASPDEEMIEPEAEIQESPAEEL